MGRLWAASYRIDRRASAIVTEQQLDPKQIFMAIVDFCWKNTVEIPTCYQLLEVITNSFNLFESKLLRVLEQELSKADKSKLNYLLTLEPGQNQLFITQIKHMNQSLRAMDIQSNVDNCRIFSDYFHQFSPVLKQLNLSDKATECYAMWVQKAESSQIRRFPNRNKGYLHLLAYIQHQYFLRQDTLIDIFIRCTCTAINAAKKTVSNNEQKSHQKTHQSA